VVFYTKPNVSPNSPVAARITINITLQDGSIFGKVLDARPELFGASKSGSRCPNRDDRFVGDLPSLHRGNSGRRRIDGKRSTADALNLVTIILASNRKKSSSLSFPRCPTDRQAFATALAMGSTAPPAADITITIEATSRCRRLCTTGTGRRQRRSLDDHPFLHHRRPSGRLARDSKIIADDDAKVTFETDRMAINVRTRKLVSDLMRYTYRDAGTRYVVRARESYPASHS
jgi:hypothetical protein